MPATRLILPLLLLIASGVSAQTWDLKRCVEYAMDNNIQVKISDVQADISDETLRQSKLSRLPTLGVSGSGSINSGLNQNPVTFNRETQTYFAARMQLESTADIFNFFSKQNTILGNEWDALANRANVDKIKYDIALTVANAYLQVLLANEQKKIALVQVQQTNEQLNNTRKLVEAGSLPELNASQLEAQLALDSVNLVSASSNVSLSTLNLKALMNMDPAAPFEVAVPPVESIPVEPIADLQPEYVYQLALANQPQQKTNYFRLKAAEKYSEAAKGAMYPKLVGFGAVGTSYFNRAQVITGSTQIFVPIGQVSVDNSDYLVYPLQPYNAPIYGKSYFGQQLTDNFNQAIGLSLNVPIFSGGSLKSNYLKSKLNLRSVELQKDQDNLKLKQDIYQAYNEASVALEKFNASSRTVTTNEKAYSFAKKRYDVGMLSTFDLITSQNNLLRAKLEYTMNRFDYVFKLKVLEFYKGLGLKL
jgi:outer membrane protein